MMKRRNFLAGLIPLSLATPGNTEMCTNCKFYHKEKMVCRRFPPIGGNEVFKKFPQVLPSDWCGEWKTK